MEHKARFFDLSADMLCITDLKGVFQDLNDAWEQILGYSREELTAAPFHQFVYPEDRERTQAELSRLVEETPTTITFENRYVCKDGTRRSLHWSATISREEGLIYAMARDVTTLRKAEARVRALNEELYQLLSSRSKELERTHIELGRLTSLASGDVADLLDGMNLALGTLAGQYGESMEEGAREQLDKARRRAKYVREIVGDFMDYAELADVALELSPVSMDSVVGATRDRMLRVLELRKAVVGWQALPRVKGDPKLLGQLLRTLMEYALRFRGASRPLVTLTSERRGEHIRFEFAHNGQPIGPELEEKVFDFGALQRRKDGTVRTTRLATCRRIVELHRGTMGIEVGVRDGARIWFSLLAADDAEE